LGIADRVCVRAQDTMRALLDHVARVRAGAEDARAFWSSLDYLAVEAPAAAPMALAAPIGAAAV
jgi:hypothetical protein